MADQSREGTYKMRSAKVTNYKMQKCTRKYFCSIFTFTATSDCRLQTDERSYDARQSAELQAYY